MSIKTQSEVNGNLPVFNFIERFFMNLRRKGAIRYMTRLKSHYLKQASTPSLSSDYRAECMTKATTYEKAILQLNYEAAVFGYEEAKLKADEWVTGTDE